MWLKPIVDLIMNLLPMIQSTALEIISWLTTEIPILSELIGISITPLYLMLGLGLTTTLTWAVVVFINNIIPIV